LEEDKRNSHLQLGLVNKWIEPHGSNSGKKKATSFYSYLNLNNYPI